MLQKNILIFLFLLSVTLSAYCQNKNTYHITGFVDNSSAPDHGKLHDGDTITISIFGTTDKKVVINNNSFSISDTIAHPGVGMILTQYCGHAIIIAPGENYNVTLKLNKLEDGYCYSTTVKTPSDVHNKWIYYTQFLTPCYNKINMYNSKMSGTDSISRAAYTDSINHIKTQYGNILYKELSECENPYVVILNMNKAPDLDISCQKYIDLFKRLPEYARNSPQGKLIYDLLMATKENRRDILFGDFTGQEVDTLCAIDTNNNKVFITKSIYKKNKYTILDFWASWCAPCRRLIPIYKELYEKLRSKNIDIIGISHDTNIDNWKEALKMENMPWTNICDPDQKSAFSNKYKIQSIPYAMIIDNNGNIVKQITGTDSIEEYIKTLIK